MSHATPDNTTHTLLIYSDDSAVRERIRMAIGRRPAPDLGFVDYIEAETAQDVMDVASAGKADALFLDAEAQPAGGIGVVQQLNNELQHRPPAAVVVARQADRWLAAWSEVDAVLAHPLDPVEAAQVAADLLHQQV